MSKRSGKANGISSTAGRRGGGGVGAGAEVLSVSLEVCRGRGGLLSQDS